MVKAQVEGTEEGGYGINRVPEYVQILSQDALGTRERVEDELDAIMRAMRTWWQLEPDEVMKLCAAYSARMSELYVHLHRVEGIERGWRQVRTQQVVPLLAELDRQFKAASRETEVRRQDLEHLRGMR